MDAADSEKRCEAVGNSNFAKLERRRELLDSVFKRNDRFTATQTDGRNDNVYVLRNTVFDNCTVRND